jgi:hypothetical protein
MRIEKLWEAKLKKKDALLIVALLNAMTIIMMSYRT